MRIELGRSAGRSIEARMCCRKVLSFSRFVIAFARSAPTQELAANWELGDVGLHNLLVAGGAAESAD